MPNIFWGPALKQIIADNSHILKDKEIAQKITELTGRPMNSESIRKQRTKMGISKSQGRGKCVVVSHKNTQP